MTVQITLAIPLVWEHVRDVRRRVMDALAEYPDAVRKAAAMTASELVENAVKYGERVGATEGVRIDFRVDAGHVTLVVVNGSTNASGVADLEARIQQIAGSSDRESLYTRRLRELLEDPSESGKLGLYRIGYEGGFDLACTWIDDVVTITAKRGLR